MSVAVENRNGQNRVSPREMNRPEAMTLNRIPMPGLNNENADSPNKPSPDLYGRSTMSASQDS